MQAQDAAERGIQVLEVEIDQGGSTKVVTVLVDPSQKDRKKYLGGFRREPPAATCALHRPRADPPGAASLSCRNKKTGVVYHHASSQTTRVPKYTEADRKLTRETQTVKVKLHSMQALRDAATQMPRPDCVIDASRDRPMDPRPYVTADEVWRVKEIKTVVLQRFTRGWFARKIARRLRAEKAEREAREQAEAEQRAREEEERTLREIERRMYPKTAEDFAILRAEVDKWQLQETKRIKAMVGTCACQAGDVHAPHHLSPLVAQGLAPEVAHERLEELLYKQTKLLQTIDRLKLQASEDIRADRVAKVLGDMSAPKKVRELGSRDCRAASGTGMTQPAAPPLQWAVFDGSVVEVHTPFTTRARELTHLYQGLNLPFTSVEARLNVLLHVKYTVKEFDCSLTREIVELVDREADLINRASTRACAPPCCQSCCCFARPPAPLPL